MDSVDSKKLKEIVEGYFQARPTSQDEMIFTVQKYIKIRKDKDVSINLFKKINQNMPEIHIIILLKEQLELLERAMDDAVQWMLNNRTEWIQE